MVRFPVRRVIEQIQRDRFILKLCKKKKESGNDENRDHINPSIRTGKMPPVASDSKTGPCFTAGPSVLIDLSFLFANAARHSGIFVVAVMEIPAVGTTRDGELGRRSSALSARPYAKSSLLSTCSSSSFNSKAFPAPKKAKTLGLDI